MEQQVEANLELEQTAFAIAGWTIDTATLRMHKEGTTVKLEPKVMAVLEYLAARPGQVVSRQELEESIWSGTVVGYDAISNAIIKLRKAFDDDAHHPRIIETITKTGYRLIADVEVENESPVQVAESGAIPLPGARSVPAGLSRPNSEHLKLSYPAVFLGVSLLVLIGAILLWFEPWAQKVELASEARMQLPLPDKPSIAVLPFLNMSDDAKQEYFVDGMTEDLITDLSKLSGLFVVARNSVFTYKGRAVKIGRVAEELGVRYVLEGSVRRVDDRVRINAQLIDALSGGHIWAERYDGEIGDVFTLQDKVSRGIVKQLALNLSIEEVATVNGVKPVHAQAYDLFLKGWGYFQSGGAGDYKSAVEIFNKVLEVDPNFSRAHAALAATYWNILEKRWWQESLGMHYHQAFELARKSLRRSQESPTVLTHQIASEWIVHFSKSRTSPRRALGQAELALKLDPNHPAGHLAMANALLYDNRPAEAEQSILVAMRLDPHYPAAYLIRLAQARFQLAQFQSAAELLEQALDKNPDNSWASLYLAAAYGQLGRLQKAREALARANKLRADNGWGPVTIVSTAHPDFRWQGKRDALKQGLDAAGAPTGGEWFRLITYIGTDKTPVVEGVTLIDAKQAKDLHERGAIFVDTRASWIAGHIPGAHFLEWGHAEGWLFNENALARLASKDSEIVIYNLDNTAKFWSQPAALAVSRGFEKVYVFSGGLHAWKAAGYPIEVPGKN